MIALLSLFACLPLNNNGGQSGSDGIECKALSDVELAADETSTLGFSPAEVQANADGAHEGTLTYASGATSALTETVTLDMSQARFVDYGWDTSGSETGAVSTEIGIDTAGQSCADAVDLPATIALSSADGQFNESFTVTLHAYAADNSQWSASEALSKVGGSYDASDVDTSSFNDGVQLNLVGAFGAGTATGAIEGQGMGHSADTGPDGTAFAQMWDIATW